VRIDDDPSASDELLGGIDYVRPTALASLNALLAGIALVAVTAQRIFTTRYARPSSRRILFWCSDYYAPSRLANGPFQTPS
jgi:hypothetical protein